MAKLVMAAMVILAAASVVQAQQGVTVVRDGKSAVGIFLAQESIASEKWAAEELRSHLNLMSGAAIAPPAAQLQNHETRIFLGLEAVRLVNPQATIENLGPDGFIIDIKAPAGGRAGEIHIYGTQPRGTLYGVYTLLESLGVRWWTPSYTHIPEMKTIVVSAGRRQEVPRLEYRDMMYMESFDREAILWSARNKLNGFAWHTRPADLIEKLGGRYRFHGNLVHSYTNLLRASGVTIEPEMQALVNDKRNDGQPCLTNPKVLEVITNEVIKVYKADPELQFVVVGQNDNNNYCRCPECKKVIDAEGESGPVILFANQVAERVEKEVPGAIITTAAYNWSRVPPKTLRPRHNVYITLCSIECDFAHPLATAQTEVNVNLRRNIQIWSKISSKLLIWDYVTNYWRYVMPHPNFDVLVPNIKFFADNGAAGVFEQAAHTGRGSDLVQLRMWVLAKGLWNPDADNWALIKEFLDGYYGPAAPAILQYLDIIHKPVRERPDYSLRIYSDMHGPYLAPDVMARSEVVLRRAADAVKGNEELEKRVRHARMGVWYVALMRGAGSTTWQAIEKSVGKTEYAQVARNFLQVAKEQGINTKAEGSLIGPWLEWLEDYAQQVAQSGPPVPPELKGRNPATYRLIQAGQMDRKVNWLVRAEGASDGWAMRIPTNAWLLRHTLDASVDFQPGRTYRLMARIKGSPKDGATGGVVSLGMSTTEQGKARHASKVTTADAMTGEWQVVEVIRWKPQHGDSYWGALQNTNAMDAVYQDCMWLEVVSE